MIDAAQEQVIDLISQADNALTKKCSAIISAHSDFFNGLTDIQSVITIGHSFSPVDYDYFIEIVKRHPEIRNAKWYFGCHGLSDINNLEKLLPIIRLKQSDVYVFRTDTIRVELNNVTTIPTKAIPSKRTLSISENGAWRAQISGRIFSIVDCNSGKIDYEAVFPEGVYDALFLQSDEYLFVKIGGIEAGIVFLCAINGHWHFENELKSIPNQRLVNPRLKQVFITEQDICFVYNSRVRKYALSDGALVLNAVVRNAPSCRYKGIDITSLITRRKNAFTSSVGSVL